MRSTIAFSNSKDHWVSRYSYTASCFGWIKDHMVSAPVSTSSQQLLWRHDGNASTNCSFYGCDPVYAGVVFPFNENPSANKIYKAFSIESPDLLAWPYNENKEASYNAFLVNNGTNNAISKSVVLNTIKSKGGILYGGVKGTKEMFSNSRVFPIGVVEKIVLNQDLFDYFGFDPEVGETAGYVKVVGPNSQHSGGDAYVVTEENVHVGVDETQGAAAKVLSNYSGGYFLDPMTGIEEGDPVLIVYRDLNSEQPKGQFADVAVVFATEADFEVHAFNVDFETTDLDHNS